MAGGIDVFARQNLASSFISYDTKTIGTKLRLGFALTENLALQPHYSIYQQEIDLPDQFNDCKVGNVPNCYQNGEASLAVRKELSAGPVLVSLIGYTLTYNTLDNVKSPSEGILASLTTDLAGLGGDVNFIRNTARFTAYHELLPDIVGVIRLQGGHVTGWGGKSLRMLDHFQLGPDLVRGFAPAGIGPRDLTPGTTNDALGGSMFWGATAELQTPLYFLPKEIGIKLATFVDAGSLWDYKGPTYYDKTGETLAVGLDSASDIRSSVGIGIVWDSPLGPLRFDLAYPLTKYCATPPGGAEVCDREQIFRFSGGTKF
jgi:outer membrane protein insertion porin family